MQDCATNIIGLMDSTPNMDPSHSANSLYSSTNKNSPPSRNWSDYKTIDGSSRFVLSSNVRNCRTHIRKWINYKSDFGNVFVDKHVDFYASTYENRVNRVILKVYEKRDKIDPTTLVNIMNIDKYWLLPVAVSCNPRMK